MTERKTGKITHANCACPCHFEHNGGGVFPATDNCRCGYDGRDEPRPRDMYFGTSGQHKIETPGHKNGTMPQEFRIYNGSATPELDGPRANFYSPPIPSEHKVAEVWTDKGGHLHIRMDMDNVFDVIFEGFDALRPRNIQFKNREQ